MRLVRWLRLLTLAGLVRWPRLAALLWLPLLAGLTVLPELARLAGLLTRVEVVGLVYLGPPRSLDTLSPFGVLSLSNVSLLAGLNGGFLRPPVFALPPFRILLALLVFGSLPFAFSGRLLFLILGLFFPDLGLLLLVAFVLGPFVFREELAGLGVTRRLARTLAFFLLRLLAVLVRVVGTHYYPPAIMYAD